MKTLIFMFLLLLLGIFIHESDGQYNFGDILSVKRPISCLCPILNLYKHFAVYVGNEKFPGKKPGQNIFHFTGPKKDQAECIFGRLEDDKGTFERDNYLDADLQPKTPAQMRESILALHRNCGRYRLPSNNCEHLATDVRYGERHLQQRRTLAGWVCWALGISRRRRRDEEKTFPVEYMYVSCEMLCPAARNSKAG
ncbi:phospholipase A and acyltransferase 4-like [Solea solea]|uniref:phospholipase A and acyltransferase 4-like n=1 Tax=Solea solea TaxID=90069 RepID=UPI00272D8400|nr:phospholipase A and acyltransferase 4-like [Solea solea]